MARLRIRLKRLRRRLPTVRDLSLLTAGALIAAAIVRWPQTATQPSSGLLALGSRNNAVAIPWLSPSVGRWGGLILANAHKYNVDPELLAIIMTVESGGNPNAQSEAGAIGLMQVTPPTAADIARLHLKQPRLAYDLHDPATSIEFGAAYLGYLRDVFAAKDQAPSWNETVELVAAGYNGGPGAASSLERGEGLHDMQTVAYSRDVYNMWRERHTADSPTYDRWLQRGGSRLVDAASH